MTWSLRLGENASWLAKVAQQQGKQFASLVDAPRLSQHEGFFFSSFQDLAGSRFQTGFGASPIMLNEILAYADLHGLSLMDERIEFVRFMRAMDGVHLNHLAKKDSVPNV